MSTKMPGKGQVALPGLVGVMPGRGVIMMPPVSVCHHVSTMGHLPPPMFSWYHSHARGLMGSPTEPSNLNDERSCFSMGSVPCFMNARMTVGARVARRTLELDGGRPVAKGPVDKVGVPCNPADVGLAPVDVVLFKVEDPLGRGLDLR